MTDQELRLRCLELAASLNLPPDEAVKAAKAFHEFLTGRAPRYAACGAPALHICIENPFARRGFGLGARVPVKDFSFSGRNLVKQLIGDLFRRVLTNMNNRLIRHLQCSFAGVSGGASLPDSRLGLQEL